MKAGRVEFKMDKAANIGVGVGKRSFTPAALQENVAAVIDAVSKAKPASFKGVFIKGVTLSSSMSPGVQLASTEFNKA
jgi:large subunit ribosomal protein L1